MGIMDPQVCVGLCVYVHLRVCVYAPEHVQLCFWKVRTF